MKEAKAAHQYTDTTGFTLKCLVCAVKMKAEAVSTKHTNFSEVEHSSRVSRNIERRI